MALSNPWIVVEFQLAKFPASLGVDVKRWSLNRPRSLQGAFYEPRIVSVGVIERMATTVDGDWVVPQTTVVLDDQDNTIGALLAAGATTEYWIGREVAIWIISQQGAEAGLTPANTSPFWRGYPSKTPRRHNRQVTVELFDVLGSLFSGYNLDQKVLKYRMKDLTGSSTVREESKDVPLSILVGEFSDFGAVDVNGDDAERGLVPAYEVFEVDITDLTNVAVPRYAAPPVITASSVVGATGQESRSYRASLITPYGESELGNAVTLDGASVRNLSNYNEISGTFDNGDPANPNKVRIWYGPTPDNMVGFLDEAYYNGAGIFGYLDGAAPWPAPTRDEIDVIKYMAPPAVSAAQTNNNIWSVMAVCLGYGYETPRIFASDLADGVEPRRQLVEDAEYGVTFIRNTDPEWPFPNPWFEYSGLKYSGFLARGPKVQHHRDKVVTIACQLCGPHDDDGKIYNQAFPSLQFLLNEHMLKNGGTGFTNGTYGTLEIYANGDSMIKTSDFAALQAKTVEWLGGLGYLSSIFIDDPEATWRDVIRKFCNTFGIHLYPAVAGQIGAFLIDTAPDEIEGRHFRERIEITESGEDEMDDSNVINKFLASYFWDLDQKVHRGLDLEFNNPYSWAAHTPGGVSSDPASKGIRMRAVERSFTADQATFEDVNNRELIRRSRRARYMPKGVPMLGMDYDIGSRGRVTDTNGLGANGNGDEETKVVVFGHALDPMTQQIVLKFRDLQSVTLEAYDVLTVDASERVMARDTVSLDVLAILLQESVRVTATASRAVWLSVSNQESMSVTESMSGATWLATSNQDSVAASDFVSAEVI